MWATAVSEHSRNPNADQLPFTVDHEQVGRRAFASGVIRIIAQAVKLVLVIGTGMTLARLLTPADFGLFAMVGSLTAFVGSFRDFGLPAATVHQAQIDQRQIDALFWINLRWNGLVLLFMLVMAPILAWFYGEVALVTITLAVAIGMFGAGSAVLPEALLTRQMRFGALTLIDLGALAVGAACGIGLAFAGAAYWALVGQLISEYLIRGGAYWLVCGWRPRRLRPGERQAEVADIITYSKDVTIFRVIAHIGRNLDRVVVGYTGGPAAMGLYDRAYQWSTFPMLNVYGPLLSVAVASLSRVRDHADRYRSYARQALLPIFTSVLPALAFMFVEARAVIRLLLGEQWLAAVPIFRLLCAAAFVGCAGTVTKIIYHSLGTTRRSCTGACSRHR
ncbi:MAG: lipopolysaccharide biosynthesis protein [Oscillochloris sp.]|nr:lipopolysaccharide biosynthesis protein [Oscillochloris sp.]